MIDQIVPPEQAEGLYRVEFNEPCAFYYDKKLVHAVILRTNKQINGTPFDSKMYAAPTWCQAFDWFRNKGYQVDVDLTMPDGTWYYRAGKFRYKEEDGLSSIQEARIKCLNHLIEMHER